MNGCTKFLRLCEIFTSVSSSVATTTVQKEKALCTEAYHCYHIIHNQDEKVEDRVTVFMDFP